MATMPADPSDVAHALTLHGYIPDDGLSTSVFLAMRLRRPLLLEGEAGVGKTEVAKVLSRWTGGELIRLQCYEGIDVSQAVYDWDYSRQLLHLRAAEATGEAVQLSTSALEQQLYNERFLLKRALLQAIDHHGGTPPVLLIDEIDRADDEFEAYLLEVLSEYQITIPELGRFSTARPPLVVLTSNRTRDVHDALKRRCLYHWVEHPDFEREVRIVRMRVPQVLEPLARQVAGAIESLRGLHLYKPPGVAETIDWAQALAALGATTLDERVVDATLGTVLKYREDQERARQHGIADLVKQAFNDPSDVVRILVATDAASEGLNLQRTARYLLHFDCPWNPSKIEQRNGRIDRHGQPSPEVLVYHFVPRVEERVSVWLDPWKDVQDTGYQSAQALYSIGNGRFGGTGLGQGTFSSADGQHLIPFANTDFIYSALAQELGLIGVSALVLVYMLVVLRGMRVALLADDGFSKLLAAGLTFGFALQTFIIVGGVVRIIPLTGITMPFVSYGGSSLLANFLMLAGLLLISNRANAKGVA